MREGVEAQHVWEQITDIPFFALPLDRKREGTIAVGALFHALPPAGAPAALPSLLGVWNCKEPDFSLKLSARGEELTVLAGGLPSGRGTLRGDVAEFAVRDGNKTYNATARLRQGKLEVTWRTTQGDSGLATCEAAMSSEKWPTSSALVELYSYDGSYTTKSKPGAMPVARVWRNPVDTLALDRGASPISAHR